MCQSGWTGEATCPLITWGKCKAYMRKRWDASWLNRQSAWYLKYKPYTSHWWDDLGDERDDMIALECRQFIDVSLLASTIFQQKKKMNLWLCCFTILQDRSFISDFSDQKRPIEIWDLCWELNDQSCSSSWLLSWSWNWDSRNQRHKSPW